MIKYRICENKYGWFKIQEYKKAWKIFGFLIRHPKWKDVKTYYHGRGNGWVELYGTRIEATKQIEEYVDYDEMHNNEWRKPNDKEA